MGLDIRVIYDGQGEIRSWDAADGYLGFNWAGVRFMGDGCRVLGIKSPFSILYPDWQGYNGEELAVTPQELERILGERATLQAWIDTAVAKPTNRQELQAWDFFLTKLKHTVALIDYLEAHKDAPGLTIYFG